MLSYKYSLDLPMSLSIGQKAPDFSLPDQNNKIHSLADFKGSYLLVYFYPKDNTPGCTTEACTLRDQFLDFKKNKINIVGVSVDSNASHEKFSAKFKLPFTLLSDVDKKMVNGYGVWGKKKFMGHEYEGAKRMSFLIHPNGRIAKIYDTVEPATHAEEVLKDVASLH